MKKEIKIYIEKITNNNLQGWFINTPEPENNKLLLFLDGQYKAVTLANRERQDVADEYGQLRCGFSFNISQYPVFKRLELKLTNKTSLLSAEIKRDESKILLKNSVSPYSKIHYEKLKTLTIDLSKTINGENWYNAEPSAQWGSLGQKSIINAEHYLLEMNILSEAKIFLEKITDKELQGWFINTSEPENNNILLFIDGEYKVATLANKERQDVADEYGQLHCGFSFDISQYPPFSSIELKSNKEKALLSAEITKVEPTGRWGGPDQESTLNIPALSVGHYLLELDISSEFCGLKDMQLKFNGTSVKFLTTDYQPPVVLQAEVHANKLDYWKLVFQYPKTSSPDGESGADQRKLGIFLKTITFTKITPCSTY